MTRTAIAAPAPRPSIEEIVEAVAAMTVDEFRAFLIRLAEFLS